MIFAIIKTYRDAKRGVKDPTGFGRDLALDAIRAPLVLFTIFGFVFLAIFFILGFTDLVLNSLGIFKVLFFIFLFTFSISEIIIWTLFNKIKAILEKAKKGADERLHTIEVEPK